MNPLLHAISTLLAAMADSLVSAICEGAILVLCVALCLHILPELSASARWVVWTSVFLLLLLLDFFPSMDSHLESGSVFQASPFHLDPLWSVAIASVWMVRRGAQLISSAIYLRGLAMRATRIQPEDSILTLLQAGKNRRAAKLCTSTEVERPCVVGFLQPCILLPVALRHSLSATDLEQVVLHEMEHLRRADDWFNLLQKAAVVLFPLNPVLFWVERRLCAEREFACDHGFRAPVAAERATRFASRVWPKSRSSAAAFLWRSALGSEDRNWRGAFSGSCDPAMKRCSADRLPF